MHRITSNQGSPLGPALSIDLTLVNHKKAQICLSAKVCDFIETLFVFFDSL